MSLNSTVIVVLNWNCADDSLTCVDSLLKQSVDDFDIMIIDNASSDNSVDAIRSYINDRPLLSNRIDLHVNKKNGGFTGGINLAFKYSLKQKYDYIGLINPDAVADRKWVESLRQELKLYPKAGMATGVLFNGDGSKIDSTGDFYTSWGLPGPRNRDEPAITAPKTSGYVFGATGGSVLYRTTLLKEIGFLDESFFMYYEDVDLAFRAQLAGFTARFTPAAIAYHNRGSSSDKVPGLALYNTFKNLPMLFFKNVPTTLFLRIFPRYLLMYSLLFGSAVRHGRGKLAMKGFLMSILLLPCSLYKRRGIQKKRKVTSTYIWSVMYHGSMPNQYGLIRLKNKFRKRK